MATDIRLDDGPAASWITAETPVLKVEGADFMLDSKDRRGGALAGYRRALVHSQGDSLTINFNGDYTGGVYIRNARINVAYVEGETPELPKNGIIGDLLVTVIRPSRNSPLADIGLPQVTLWLCIGKTRYIHPLGDVNSDWIPISYGEAIEGTA